MTEIIGDPLPPDWVLWGFEPLVAGSGLILCPVCQALTTATIRQSGNVPYMDHILWHKKVQNDGSTFGWSWPFFPEDRQVSWHLGARFRAYREQQQVLKEQRRS
jgi:hypothetical protein